MCRGHVYNVDAIVHLVTLHILLMLFVLLDSHGNILAVAGTATRVHGCSIVIRGGDATLGSWPLLVDSLATSLVFRVLLAVECQIDSCDNLFVFRIVPLYKIIN
jgi:hypothetical protein